MKQKLYKIGLSLLVLISAVVALISSTATAAQLSSRSIKLSSAAPGATGVTYAVSFTTSGSFQSLIIDFCNESPIIGSATCTAPAGMSVASPTVNFTSGTIGTVSTTGSSASQLKIAGTAAQGAGSIAFTAGGITNPTSTGTFYARIYTYSNAGFGTPTAYASTGSPGSTVDTGGVALSTSSTINLSATIMESLTFCVSGTSVSSCASPTAPGFSFGSGSPPVLGTALSTNPVYTFTSTNALGGVTIAMKNSNSCGGLSRDGGTTCPIAAVGASASTIATGASRFGAYMANSTGQTGQAVNGLAPYNVSGSYGMDATAGTGVASTYGQAIASAGGPTGGAQNTLTFAADTSNTTPAGIYTATMTLVATGTF